MAKFEAFSQEVEAARRRHPEIAAGAARAAMGRYVERASQDDPEAVDNLVDIAAAQNREDGAFEQRLSDRAILETIPNPEVRAALESTIDAARNIYEHHDLEHPIKVPALQEFLAAGVDFAKLTSDYLGMTRDNLEPVIVIAPILTPDEQTLVFENLAKQGDIIPNNPLRAHSLEFADVTSDITAQELIRVRHNSVIHSVIVDDGIDIKTWTLNIVPGSIDVESKHLNTLYSDNQGNHVSFSTYLAMQAELIWQGKPPVDTETCSWLDETHIDDRGIQSPFEASCSLSSHRIFIESIASTGNGNRLEIRGARLPVWE
jgi:hypothetical protein